MAPSPSGGKGGGGATISITIAEGAISLGGGKTAHETMAMLEDNLADILEKAAQRAGAHGEGWRDDAASCRNRARRPSSARRHRQL